MRIPQGYFSTLYRHINQGDSETQRHIDTFAVSQRKENVGFHSVLRALKGPESLKGLRPIGMPFEVPFNPTYEAMMNFF